VTESLEPRLEKAYHRQVMQHVNGPERLPTVPSAPEGPLPPRTRVRMGQVWIDALTFVEAIREIERLVDRGEGGAVFTPNVDHVVQVDKNPAFRAAYDEVSLSLVDGQPLIWASRILGSPLPEKISGSDLIAPLMQCAERRRFRVYLLGGAPGVGALAASKLKEQYEVDIVGVDAPHVTAAGKAVDEAAVLERITKARPHIVLVAFGAPKQELFIHTTMSAIRPAVAIGVGAGFDFVAGRIRRAPTWVSRGGLEWLFRLAQEPRRLARRYLVDDPKFLGILYRTLRDPKCERVEVRSAIPPVAAGGGL
jgi:N-acetylglucosaminyldiphosphoundecaprenol N-acetyl-beta-D-mannosaminyltransferase